METLTFKIKLKDLASPKIFAFAKNSERVSSKVGSTFSKLGKNMARGFQRGFDGLKGKHLHLLALNEAAQNLSQTFGSAVNTGADFEQSMADLQAITGIAGKDLDKLGAFARQAGKETGLGAATSVNAMKTLASQIDVSKIGMGGLFELQKKSAILSQASGMDIEESAMALSGTINQFGLDAQSALRVINVLAASSKYGAAEVGELTQSFKVTGGAAAGLGVSVEETAGALEVLSKNNLKGAEAGTALRNILLKMKTTLGMDVSNGGFVQGLKALRPKLKDTAFLAKTFGTENINAAQFIIQNAKAVEEMTQRVTGTGVATEQAAIRTDTYTHKTAVLGAKFDDLKISLFDSTKEIMPFMSGLGNTLMIGGQVAMGISALTGLFNRLKIAKTLTTVATWALNAAFWANPITWVVAGVAGLIATVVICWNKFEGFRGVIKGTWAAMKVFGNFVWNTIIGCLKALLGLVVNLRKAVAHVFQFEFAKAGEAAMEGLNGVRDVMVSTAKETMNLGSNMSEAFNKNYDMEVSIAGKKSPEKSPSAITQTMILPQKKVSNKKIAIPRSDLTTIATGGGKTSKETYVNIDTIGKFGNVTISNPGTASVKKIEKNILNALTRAIDGAIALS